MVDEDALRAALERSSPPWTVSAILDRITDPDGLKARSPLCERCDAPCSETEVCVTSIAEDTGLLDDVDREQAFHLVESGVERLELRNEVEGRSTEEIRPNTFVSRKE